MRWLLLALMLYGCTSGDKENAPTLSSVTVGMTYEEVERILGKPLAIERGAGELNFPDGPDRGPKEKRRIERCRASHLADSGIMQIQAPPVYRHVGSLLYVAWVYDQTPTTIKAVMYDPVYSSGDMGWQFDSCARIVFNLDYVRTLLFDASSGRMMDDSYRPPSRYAEVYREP